MVSELVTDVAVGRRYTTTTSEKNGFSLLKACLFAIVCQGTLRGCTLHITIGTSHQQRRCEFHHVGAGGMRT